MKLKVTGETAGRHSVLKGALARLRADVRCAVFGHTLVYGSTTETVDGVRYWSHYCTHCYKHGHLGEIVQLGDRSRAICSRGAKIGESLGIYP